MQFCTQISHNKRLPTCSLSTATILCFVQGLSTASDLKQLRPVMLLDLFLPGYKNMLLTKALPSKKSKILIWRIPFICIEPYYRLTNSNFYKNLPSWEDSTQKKFLWEVMCCSLLAVMNLLHTFTLFSLLKNNAARCGPCPPVAVPMS